jgi:hypothetical protein
MDVDYDYVEGAVDHVVLRPIDFVQLLLMLHLLLHPNRRERFVESLPRPDDQHYSPHYDHLVRVLRPP